MTCRRPATSTRSSAAGGRNGSRRRAGSYLSLELGDGLGGGIVECPVRGPLWLPYVEVDEIAEATDRARGLGASVLLEPREGPAGWRSVVRTAVGGEIAFWQPKATRPHWRIA